jgi:hypothetical protein
MNRLQRAFGLPRVDEPDVAVYLRADGEAAARANSLSTSASAPTKWSPSRGCWEMAWPRRRR